MNDRNITGLVTIVAALLLGAALAACGGDRGASSATDAIPQSQRQLHRDGPWIVDGHGRVMLLHGPNQVWKAAPEIPPVTAGGITDADAARMASYGWNTVRLGVRMTGLMPAKGAIDPAYLDKVEAAVDLFGRHGLHVLLDIHQDLYGAPWGSGFPDWMVPLDQPVTAALLRSLFTQLRLPPLLAALPSTLTIGQLAALEPDLGFPLNGLRPSSLLAWDFFWGDSKLAADDPQGVIGYVGDALAALAARLGKHPKVMGVEIINETFPGTALASCAALATPVGCLAVDQYVQSAWQYLTDRMRAVAGPDLLIWWEPNVIWNETAASNLSNPPLTPAVTDPQIGFAFHDYCGPAEIATYLGTPDIINDLSCDAFHAITWSHFDAIHARTGWPGLVTEFGNRPEGVELERTLSRADARFVGWHQWMNGITDQSELRPEPVPYDDEVLKHFVRSYPQATAGIPKALFFDPETGDMRYSYEPRALGVPTEIYISSRHYPDGYELLVTGGRAGARPAPGGIVTIEADPGAALVEIVVRRIGA